MCYVAGANVVNEVFVILYIYWITLVEAFPKTKCAKGFLCITSFTHQSSLMKSPCCSPFYQKEAELRKINFPKCNQCQKVDRLKAHPVNRRVQIGL